MAKMDDGMRDPQFSSVDYDRARRLIASGINPYDHEEALAHGIEPLPEGHPPERRSLDALTEGNASSSRERPRAGSKTKIDYKQFGQCLSQYGGVRVDEIHAQIETKRAILSESGYDFLITGKGRRVPLKEANDSRVGLAFQKVHRAYRSYLERTDRA